MSTITDILIKCDNAQPIEQLTLLAIRLTQDMTIVYGILDRKTMPDSEKTCWKATISSHMARLNQLNYRLGILQE